MCVATKDMKPTNSSSISLLTFYNIELETENTIKLSEFNYKSTLESNESYITFHNFWKEPIANLDAFVKQLDKKIQVIVHGDLKFPFERSDKFFTSTLSNVPALDLFANMLRNGDTKPTTPLVALKVVFPIQTRNHCLNCYRIPYVPNNFEFPGCVADTSIFDDGVIHRDALMTGFDKWKGEIPVTLRLELPIRSLLTDPGDVYPVVEKLVFLRLNNPLLNFSFKINCNTAYIPEPFKYAFSSCLTFSLNKDCNYTMGTKIGDELPKQTIIGSEFSSTMKRPLESENSGTIISDDKSDEAAKKSKNDGNGFGFGGFDRFAVSVCK